MKKRSIYVAAKYNRRHELRDLAGHLETVGIATTSQWIYNAEESKKKEDAALMDLNDIDRADAVLFFAEPQGSENRGGGRYFELGYAHARGKPTFVILTNGHETVFTHLRQMTLIDDCSYAGIVATLLKHFEDKE